MATVAESSEPKPSPPPSEDKNNPKTLDEATLWVEYAVQQAQLYQKAAEEVLDSAIESSRSRLSQIRCTSSAHFHQTIVNFLNSH
jgi:hypothetical protein